MSRSFVDWSYVHRVIGKDVIIAGHDHPAKGETENKRRPNWDRVGTAKAVVDFVRQFMGVRFLYPEIPPYTPVSAAAKIDLLASPAIEFLPMKTIAVPADLNVQKTPVLRLNTAHPAGGGFYDLAHNRFPRVDEVFGGHTWERAVPPEKYFDDAPGVFRADQRLTAEAGGRQGAVLPVESGRAGADLSRPRLLAGPRLRLGRSRPAGRLSRMPVREVREALRHRQRLEREDLDLQSPGRRATGEIASGPAGDDDVLHPHRRAAEDVHEVSRRTPASCSPARTRRTSPRGAASRCRAGFTGYIYNWCPNLGTRYTPMRTPGLRRDAGETAGGEPHPVASTATVPASSSGSKVPSTTSWAACSTIPSTTARRSSCPSSARPPSARAAFYMRSFYDQLYHAIALYSDHIGTRCDVWTYQPIEGRPRKTVTDPFQLIAFLYTPSLLAALEADLTQAEKLANTDKVKTRLALVRTEFEYLKHFARVVHLHQAYQMLPDAASRDRLLDAIDARNAFIAALYDKRGNPPSPSDWSHVLFPFAGHDANHLRLAYDGYQEPYANTCFNWDTKAMRNAPSPGKKRLTVTPATAPVTLDAPQWQQTTPHELTLLPPLSTLPRKTTMRLLYDKTNLYIRAECELEPDGPAEFPAFPRDRDLRNQESLDIYLAPQAGREVFYRFLAGANAASKYDAVSGLITDAMDPRHGKDDPTWNGDWQCESRIDCPAHRWHALIAIPFQTLAIEPPTAGVTWRGNFARYHQLPRGKIDRSIWSSTIGSTSMDDRSTWGEIAFESGSEP